MGNTPSRRLLQYLAFSKHALNGFVLGLLLAASTAVAAEDLSPTWKFGAAQAKITPTNLFWMGGFAFRTHPAEGTLDDLYVKALALEAPEGGVALLVTVDLVGIPQWLYHNLSVELLARYHLDTSRIRFASSHTHSGPVLTDALRDIYPLDDQQHALINSYSRWLQATMLETAAKALSSRSPATLWAGEGRATFAYNRRTNDESKRDQALQPPKGPSDFTVPVLAVRAPDGQLRAVVFGYAAHTSALNNSYLWSADYAGVTQRALESRHPNAAAMFFQGCGSDQSAVPRGTVQRCQALGDELAESVEKVLNGPMRPLSPVFQTGFEYVSLDFSEQPTKAELDALGQGQDYRARWARRLSAELAAAKPFPKGYPLYPVQVWRLGTNQLWIALGGEVCVDYALRFEREFGPTTWVNGYANDVMAYIPSRRLWDEGGYQAGAFDVYGLPANRWCSDIEDRIAGAVERLVKAVQPTPGTRYR